MNYNYSIKPMNLSCDVEKPWDDGLSLYNYLDSVVSRYIFLKPPPRPRGDILTDKKYKTASHHRRPIQLEITLK